MMLAARFTITVKTLTQGSTVHPIRGPNPNFQWDCETRRKHKPHGYKASLLMREALLGGIMALETGRCPPGALGSSESSHVQREKSDRWFLAPLRDMKGDQAFIAMMVCIALYEKYLRVAKGLGDDATFSKGSKAFRFMAEDFDFPPDDCYRFWQDWRNGLLHRAMPNIAEFEGYFLKGGEYPKALQIDGKTLKIDPWKFRDIVVRLVDKERAMWKDPKNPLAKIMESTEGP